MHVSTRRGYLLCLHEQLGPTFLSIPIEYRGPLLLLILSPKIQTREREREREKERQRERRRRDIDRDSDRDTHRDPDRDTDRDTHRDTDTDTDASGAALCSGYPHEVGFSS